MKRIMKNKKGFTMAELLIVVAIIAVLVAIAIPVFTTQLEKSRDATDAANLRSAYAEVVANHLTDASDSTVISVEQKGTDASNAAFSEFNSDFSVAAPKSGGGTWSVKWENNSVKATNN